MNFKKNGKCPYYQEAEIPCEECPYYEMCKLEFEGKSQGVERIDISERLK